MKPLSIAQLQALQDAVLDNANDLISDAVLLAQNGRHPRAFSLLVLACEELSKSPILSQACVLLTLKEPVDWDELQRFLRTHDQKLLLMSLFDMLTALQVARKSPTLFLPRGLTGGVRKHPRALNVAKQNGFYVDVDSSGTPCRPSAAITPDDVAEAHDFAERALHILREAVVDGRAFLAREPVERLRQFRKDLQPLAQMIRTLLDGTPTTS